MQISIKNDELVRKKKRKWNIKNVTLLFVCRAWRMETRNGFAYKTKLNNFARFRYPIKKFEDVKHWNFLFATYDKI